ncbi:MAG: AAA family ATPase [Acidimicrobiales bacterium]
MAPSPLFVCVNGPPGSGKSTLAGQLALSLGVPLIAKDLIKEALMSEIAVPDVEASKTLGRAATGVLFAVAARASSGAVLESNFHRSLAAASLAQLPGAVVEVFCRCDRDTAAARYRARASSRLGGHFDSSRTAEEIWHSDVTEPVAGGWPVLEIDTSHPVDVAQVVADVRRLWASEAGEPT